MKNKNLITVGVIVLIVLIFGGWFIGTSNSIIGTESAVDEQWANVESKLQRRYDLIPNLVNSVKADMKNEQKIFGDIANARKMVTDAKTTNDKVKANNELEKQTGILVNAIRENYPDLKSSKNVQGLMDELSGTENRISVERDKYNKTVKEYNNKIRMFPGSIIAGMQGKQARDYFKAQDEAQNAPKVDFDN